MNWIIRQVRKEEWSPYVAGILLGIVGILTVLLANSTLGASGGFENLAGMIGKALSPKLSITCTSTSSCPPGSPFSCAPDRHLLRRHARRALQRHIQVPPHG